MTQPALPIDPGVQLPSAVLTHLLIGDADRPAGAWTPARFPFTGEVFAQAPAASVDEAKAAVAAGAAAQRPMAALSSAQRRSIVDTIRERLAAREGQLQRLLVLETGKPLVDCRVETARTLTTWQAAGDEITRLTGETVPLDLQPLGTGMLGYFTRKPAGLILGIAGFNYPLLLATHKIAPALAAGCPIILKPSPDTVLTTAWMVSIIRDVLAEHGAPRAAAQLVSGAPEVGEALVADQRVQVISFTGSAAVGHLISRNAAPRKTVLELGSATGLIVAEDGDVDAAVDAVLRGGFYANGQACISVQRVVLARPIAQRFTEALLERLPEVIVGDPRDEATRVAPVINARSAERILSWIDAAAEAGATVLAGGRAASHAKTGLVAPTVLTGVEHSSLLWAEEIFGPVVCLDTVETMNEAIDLVNDSRYGLQASVYTASLSNAFAAIDRLAVGGVVVNEIPGFRSDVMPYGGVKDSGIGREGPRWAMEEFTVTRMAMIRPA